MEKTTRAQRDNARWAAARVVYRHLLSGAFPDRELERISANRAWVTEVALGVVRQRRALRWMVRRLVSAPPRPRIEAALLVGLYQLFFMREEPAYAAVNETVEAAKALAGQHAADFVNAVLRRAQKEKGELRKALAEAPLGVRLSHPDWLLARWRCRFGKKGAWKLCRWNNTPAEVILRVRTTKATLAQFRERLAAAGVSAEPHPYRPEAFLVLPRGVSVDALPGYAEGLFTVQDPSTALAVELLNPQPGEKILDACAAPGGKTIMIADRLGGLGMLVGLEVREDRLAVLKENLARAGCSEVRALCADARQWRGEERFDGVLLDVPCSNTGVIRRRPDVRWRLTQARLEQLVRLQRALLNHAATLVRPGGRMVYSTCSLEPEENEALIQDWVARHPEFQVETSSLLFPPSTRTDGAFAALLRRTA